MTKEQFRDQIMLIETEFEQSDVSYDARYVELSALVMEFLR